ncbi:hypothetical protein ABIC83_002463 [Roseateles asaccharophilus]|uniref:hypothetical protein n=1 Tax=Roseateles asaccharophilus TaxID=582607 RepID=UPI0038381755
MYTKAFLLLEHGNGSLRLIEESTLGERDLPHVPGFVVLARVDDAETVPLSVAVAPMPIWGVDFENFCVEPLRELLEEDESRAEQFNIAVWCTGFYSSDVPLHVFALSSDGSSAGWLCWHRKSNPMPSQVMAASMRLIQDRFKKLERRGYFEAFQFAADLNSESGDLVLAMKEDLEAIDEGWSRRFQKELERVQAEAAARRKAAVAAKNLQLDAANAKVRGLTQELGKLRQACRVLEGAASSSTAPSSQAKQVETVTSSLAPTLPIEASDALDDEAISNTRFTVEYQAEVIRQLRLSLRHANESRSKAQGEGDAVQELAPATSKRRLSELAGWAAENADRVIVLKRAISAAKKSVYEDEEFVFQALDLLATTYRDVKLGLVDRMAYKTACEKLGVDFGGSIDVQQADDYFFNWNGRRRFLDQHLGKGIARDPRYCFRAYFTWDEDEAKVIIGWVPSHLPTRST